MAAYVFVTLPNENLVLVIDTSTNAVVASLPVAGNPVSIATAPGGGLLYVACAGFPGGPQGGLSAIYTTTNPFSVTTTSLLPSSGAPLAVAFASRQDLAFVTLGGPTPTLAKLNTARSVEGAQGVLPALGDPAMVAASPDGQKAYVGYANAINPSPSSVVAVDSSTFAVLATYEVPFPLRSLEISSDGAYLYATGGTGLQCIARIATSDGQTVTFGREDLPVSNELAIGPGNRLYVTQFDGTLAVFDSTSLQLVADPIAIVTPEGGVAVLNGIALTADGAFAYVAAYGDTAVHLIDAASLQVVGAPIAIPDARHPIQVALAVPPLEWHRLPGGSFPNRWLVNPDVLLLSGEVFVRLNLPDPAPEEEIAARLAKLASQMTTAEREAVRARIAGLRTYLDVAKSVFGNTR